MFSHPLLIKSLSVVIIAVTKHDDQCCECAVLFLLKNDPLTKNGMNDIVVNSEYNAVFIISVTVCHIHFLPSIQYSVILFYCIHYCIFVVSGGPVKKYRRTGNSLPGAAVRNSG